jgi:hypothetical protein
LHCGFARVRCDHCGHEYLPAYSCKRRHFAPPAIKKEWLNMVNGCFQMGLKMFPIASGFSAPRNAYGSIFYLTENCWANSANVHGRSSEHILNMRRHIAVSFPAPVLWFISYGDFLNLAPFGRTFSHQHIPLSHYYKQGSPKQA